MSLCVPGNQTCLTVCPFLDLSFPALPGGPACYWVLAPRSLPLLLLTGTLLETQPLKPVALSACTPHDVGQLVVGDAVAGVFPGGQRPTNLAISGVGDMVLGRAVFGILGRRDAAVITAGGRFVTAPGSRACCCWTAGTVAELA